ncbi:TOM core complex subunit Tom6 [Geosmithia morbida]|uniref:TOM core complex subunit Tom6 n=1 Tax=Geosmithia morbida TaxID=1094350 RepID=A0A9P4Z3J2_9HYPO|nr:TOM core complex subunit Tom6 [Geosmithia morbida]KAF4125969.1 TOM core complex subunit Tom6 [Geosmithia morbida]
MSPAKRIVVERSGPRGAAAPKGFFGSTYDVLTSSENAAVVRSIGLFGAAVVFLQSSWGEILLPPQ